MLNGEEPRRPTLEPGRGVASRDQVSSYLCARLRVPINPAEGAGTNQRPLELATSISSSPIGRGRAQAQLAPLSLPSSNPGTSLFITIFPRSC